MNLSKYDNVCRCTILHSDEHYISSLCGTGVSRLKKRRAAGGMPDLRRVKLHKKGIADLVMYPKNKRGRGSFGGKP